MRDGDSISDEQVLTKFSHSSMCEEVQHPATQVPIAMIWTIILNAVCGFIFLVPLVFVLPTISSIVNDPSGQPLPVILSSAIGSEGGSYIDGVIPFPNLRHLANFVPVRYIGAFALALPIIILGFFCGIGCTTAASRCTWAFARDGAIPGSHLWKTVNKKLDVPLNAMMLSMSVQLILGLVYFGSYAAFNAFNGAGVIFLTLSYVMPIATSFFRGRKVSFLSL